MSEPTTSAIWEARDFWVAGSGAILGSLTAGLISFLLQWQNLKEARKMRNEEKAEKQKSLGISVARKAVDARTLFSTVQSQFVQALEAAEYNSNPEIWPYVKEMINPFEPAYHTHDELGLIFEAEAGQLYNELRRMNLNLDSMTTLINAHNTKLLVLRDALEEAEKKYPDSAEYQAFVANAPSSLRMKMNNVNDITEVVYQMAREGAHVADKLLIELDEVLNDHLKLDIIITTPDGRPVRESPPQNNA